MQQRQTSIRVLYYLHQLDPTKLGPMVLEVMYAHRLKLVQMLDAEENKETAAYIEEELEIVDDAIAAPSRPFKTNFSVEKENYSSGAGVLNLQN